MNPLFLLSWAALAMATEYVVEGPPTDDRGVAVAASREVRELGHDARVVRRTGETGGTYVVHVSGSTEMDAAVKLANEVAEPLGGAVAVLRYDTPESEAVVVWSTGTPAGETVAGKPQTGALAPTIAAHGGVDGGAAKIASAPGVLFKFRRELPEGDVVEHRWARKGTALSLEVVPVSGTAVASRTLVTDGGAWLSTRGGAYAPQDRERTLETLGVLSPDMVVPFVLTFAPLATERRELLGLRDAGDGEDEGVKVRRLVWDGDQASGALEIEVDARTHLVRRVIFEGGAKVVRFDGWSEGDVRLPRVVETWREGERVDRVEILEFSLSGDLPNEWFEAP